MGFIFLLFLWGSAWEEEPKTYNRCGTYELQACKESLEVAAEVAARCGFHEEPRCLMVFVDTLSEIDGRAPFYGGVFNGAFDMGNIQYYRPVYERLSRRDQNTLRDLSALVGLQALQYYGRKGQLQGKQRDIENAVRLRVERYTKKPYKEAKAGDIQNFMAKVRQFFYAIQWPRVPEGEEGER